MNAIPELPPRKIPSTKPLQIPNVARYSSKDSVADPLESLKQEASRLRYELEKNPQFSQFAEEARKAKSFEEFANGTYEVPIKNLHGNVPEVANTPGLSRTPNEP